VEAVESNQRPVNLWRACTRPTTIMGNVLMEPLQLFMTTHTLRN